jgi:hypothetical protein
MPADVVNDTIFIGDGEEDMIAPVSLTAAMAGEERDMDASQWARAAATTAGITT